MSFSQVRCTQTGNRLIGGPHSVPPSSLTPLGPPWNTGGKPWPRQAPEHTLHGDWTAQRAATHALSHNIGSYSRGNLNTHTRAKARTCTCTHARTRSRLRTRAHTSECAGTHTRTHTHTHARTHRHASAPRLTAGQNIITERGSNYNGLEA